MMHQPINDEPVIRFFKLKTNEDIVAYELSSTKTYYVIRRPLAFTIENEVLSGRQMLNIREWIPPIVCSVDTIQLPKEYVMFSTDVVESFKLEFKEAVEFLYNVRAKPKNTMKSSDNSIPVSALMKDTSTKPH